MQQDQTTGILLPLGALVRRDRDGKTWLAYTDPVWLANATVLKQLRGLMR